MSRPVTPDQPQLNSSNWPKVVTVAGCGTILEWFDFYIYTQLSSVLTKVFFPTDDATAQALSYWGVFAAAFVVRPLGALIFGHIGDTIGRNRTLMIAIICMAIPTVIIGCLPTYETGSYTAGIAAPVLLALMRMLQGLAMGGEFGSAVIYISELASTNRRGLYVALLQCTVNIGMMLATILVMLLENTISAENMLIWGWRIPFLIAFLTALLGFALRRGMPEPHSFLEAARSEKALAAGATDIEYATDSFKLDKYDSRNSSKTINVTASSKTLSSVNGGDDEEDGVLSKFQGNARSKVPIIRLLRNNLMGYIIQVCFMAWVSGAFYLVVSWLMASLKKGGMPPIHAQGLLIVSLLFNAAGLIGTGIAFDKGMRAITANAIIVLLGIGFGFILFLGVTISEFAAWALVCVMHLVIGSAMAIVVLPCTRIYSPLERTTGFSFGYNTGYGVLGGLSPLIVTSIKSDLSAELVGYAPCFWLVGLGLLSFIGCATLKSYKSRLNKPYVGHIE